MPQGRHIYTKASDMEKSTICTYLQSAHELPHWKCLLWCWDDCPCITLTDQETDNQYSEITPSIQFHVYNIIGHCTSHGRIPLKDKKYVHM